MMTKKTYPRATRADILKIVLMQDVVTAKELPAVMAVIEAFLERQAAVKVGNWVKAELATEASRESVAA